MTDSKSFVRIEAFPENPNIYARQAAALGLCLRAATSSSLLLVFFLLTCWSASVRFFRIVRSSCFAHCLSLGVCSSSTLSAERERERGRPRKAASSFNSKIKVNVILNSMKEQAHHPSPFVSEGLARFGGRLKRPRLRWLSPEVSPPNETNPEEEV